ncbi:MAG: DegT/DnrJ/EryC1/StrS family aminotransferase [Spirochaetia bacterium]|nr:DegT/DnrJ/EryC1/StrS family aminotransferase [Spirochaetia bacterium]
MNKFIPVNEPLLNGNEKKYLNECIDTGWISSEGPFIKKFEQGMADYIGRKYAVAVTNGTAALEMAVVALELKEGDEVIMPTFTIISCAQALVKAGVKPVLVDCELDTFNMKIGDVESKITKNTKAIMVVHIYGMPVDMDPLMKLAEKYNLKIIEDAAEAHGQTYKGKKCGSFGDISILSFYPNKHITTGEGGMVLTDDEDLAKRCESLRNLCFIPERRFVHEELGWNLRMTNIQAAIGVAQLERIQEFVAKKRWIGQMYQDLLKDIKVISLPIPKKEYAENIYWVFTIALKDDFSQNSQQVMKELQQKGIGTRPFFYPMHKQPVFNKMGLFLNEHLPNSEKVYERGFYIPSGLAISKEQIEGVSKVLHEVLV